MKIEVTFIEDDARLVQTVFTYLGMNNVVDQQEQVKRLIYDWVQKWQLMKWQENQGVRREKND